MQGYSISTNFGQMDKKTFASYVNKFGGATKTRMQSVWDRLNPAPVKPTAAATTQTKATKTGISASASKALAAAKAMYAPGGAYGKGLEASLERGAQKSIASGTQAMVSSGLASTTMPAGLGKQYEEEVATPARAELESRRAEALSGLSMAEAQMQEGASESAAMRGFQASESAADRASRLSIAGMSRSGGGGGGGWTSGGSDEQPGGTFASRSLARAKEMEIVERTRMMGQNQPKQHISGGSGMNSFLSNLQSSDLMSTTGGKIKMSDGTWY
jgi:hypothetical protein